MCCTTRESTVATEQTRGCGCGCIGPAGAVRRFLSDQEEADRLDAYRQELLKEAGEVEKRVMALRAKD